MNNIIYKEDSYKIVGACIEVHKTLGNGFLEPVYQEALAIELALKEIPYQQEKELNIIYKDHELEKSYYADFVCYNKIILEIKALTELKSDHESQILNYLKATGYKLGLLINFGQKSLKYKRIVKESTDIF